MRLLPILVAASAFYGNIGNKRVADVAKHLGFGNIGNALVELIVADVADVAVEVETSSSLRT